MKHAYLIIAHNEFDLLQRLISALDDERNDIYVHIDKKVKYPPLLVTLDSKLYVLPDRVDIRWGSVSQIEAEYALFEKAYHNRENYSRYHLISGTHLPLKSQDEIHSFFEENKEKEILSYIYTNSYEVDMKLGRYHFFLENYRSSDDLKRKLSQLFWHILIKIQYLLYIHKQAPRVTIKANNWVSLTDEAVAHVLSKKVDVLKLFRRSFCGDEYFVPYLLENAGGRFKMENCQNLLFNDFQEDGNPRLLTITDYDFLIGSDYLFARKFSEKYMYLVDKIVRHVKK